MPHDAAQGRYVNPTNACQSFQPHPSTFAFSGFEGAKRHRLCRPSGNPLGLNPAGVLPFRMRAHQMENAPWKAGRSVGTSHPLPHRPSLCGSALGPRIRHFPTHTVVGQAFPLGFWCLICSLPDAFADWTIVPQLGQAWVNERTTSPFRAVTSTQPMPAKASSPTHPPLLLAGSKVLNGTGSADQVPTRWA